MKLLSKRQFCLKVPAFIFLASTAFATSSPVSADDCREVVSRALAGHLASFGNEASRLTGNVARLTARSAHGFLSFGMNQTFNFPTTPIGTPAAANANQFFAKRVNNYPSAYSGEFTEVFTDRGNKDTEKTALWVTETGDFWLRSVTYSGGWSKLNNTACYSGPRNQFIVFGVRDGADFWSFLLSPYTLI